MTESKEQNGMFVNLSNENTSRRLKYFKNGVHAGYVSYGVELFDSPNTHRYEQELMCELTKHIQTAITPENQRNIHIGKIAINTPTPFNNKNLSPSKSNIFIKIENRYAFLENGFFPLSNLQSVWPVNDQNGPVQIFLFNGDNHNPSITYNNFISFLEWVINESNKITDPIQVFTLLINEDLTCEWHR